MTAPSRAPAPHGGVVREIGLLADGVERFCADSLSLAKLEAVEAARSMAGDLARIGAFAVLAGVGYGLLCVALALALVPTTGAAAAFLAVGAANAVAGAVGLAVVVHRLSRAAP